MDEGPSGSLILSPIIHALRRGCKKNFPRFLAGGRVLCYDKGILFRAFFFPAVLTEGDAQGKRRARNEAKAYKTHGRKAGRPPEGGSLVYAKGSPMKIGVSTACYYPLETEKAARILAQNGVAATEVFINTHSELERPYLLELKQILDAGGVEVLTLHPYTSGYEPMVLFSEYVRRFEDAREYYKRYFEAAAFLGAGAVVIHGGRPEGPLTDEEYIGRYLALNETAETFGVKIAHENASLFRGRSPAFLKKIKDALGPKAAFVLDLKQAIRAGQDWREFFRLLGGSIVQLHLSDHDEGSDCLPVGRGKMDWPSFFAGLKASGFDGGAVLELYRHSYGDYPELIAAYHKMCRLAGQNLEERKPG